VVRQVVRPLTQLQGRFQHDLYHLIRGADKPVGAKLRPHW
jgi:hypothetical protein